MTKLNSGKASILALIAVFGLSVVLLVNSLTKVFAEQNNDNNGDNEHQSQDDHDNDNHDGDNHDGDNNDGEEENHTPTPKPPKDVCPNLQGNQPSLPEGYHFNNDDQCVPNETDETPAPESTPTPEVTATPTPDPDVCPNLDGVQLSIPDTYHKDPGTRDCIQYQMGGAPPPSGGPGGGQVLGASTMAGTGTFTENLYMAIMGLGGIITAMGAKNLKKAFKVA